MKNFLFEMCCEWRSCAVECKFGFDNNKKADAAFGLPHGGGTAGILRSMESAQYYPENNLDLARRWVRTI
ncbi:putative glycosyl transferase family 10 [Helianthus annuus]|nr:putative glycosyl transferase family 10 [Helianthus annuus]